MPDELSKSQNDDLMVLARLIGPLTNEDISSATTRNKKINVAFKVLTQLKTQLKSKKFAF